MGKDSSQMPSWSMQQLKKYAEDLASVHRSEKQVRKQLQAVNEQLVRYADDLNKAYTALQDSHEALQAAYLDTIFRLVLAAEYKDEDTKDHLERMSRYCALLAEKIGLSASEVENLSYAAPMHDVGKIGIPDSILLKPGKLTREEFEVIKTHTLIGAKILADSQSEILQLAQQIALHHHERWNGTGYPGALTGENIPLAGRIVGLADTFDALTSRRPYKNPYPVEVAISMIIEQKEIHFDPDLVAIFGDNIDDILLIKKEVTQVDDEALPDFSWSERDLEKWL